VPLTQTQGGTPGSPASGTIWTFSPANNTHTLADFALRYWPGTFGGVLETQLALGYNPNFATTGKGGGWITFLPDAGDTNATEVAMIAGFTDDTSIQAWMMQASLATPGNLTQTFHFGRGASDQFAIQDGNSVAYFIASPALGGSAFYKGALQMLPPTGSAVFTLTSTNSFTNIVLNPNGGSHDGSIVFQVAGTSKWFVQGKSGGTWVLTDAVNSVSAITATAAAGKNGSVALGSVLKPVQAATASAPTYVKGGVYFDTTLNKLMVGGATAWETVTSA
jgi:hypothetical protein